MMGNNDDHVSICNLPNISEFCAIEPKLAWKTQFSHEIQDIASYSSPRTKVPIFDQKSLQKLLTNGECTIVLTKSATGMGKSSSIRGSVDSIRREICIKQDPTHPALQDPQIPLPDFGHFLAISSLRAVARTTSELLNFKCYLDEDVRKLQADPQWSREHSLVISTQSLHKLFQEMPRKIDSEWDCMNWPTPTFVIIDEVCSILSDLTKRELYTKDVRDVMFMLQWVLVNAKVILCADANLDQWHVQRVLEIRAAGIQHFGECVSDAVKNRTNTILLNWNRYFIDPATYFVRNVRDTRVTLRAEGSCMIRKCATDRSLLAIFTNTLRMSRRVISDVVAVKPHLRNALAKIRNGGVYCDDKGIIRAIVVTGDAMAHRDVAQAMAHPNRMLADCEVIIGTHCMATGIDIQIPVENVFVFGEPYTCTARDLLQLTQRFRNKKNVHLGLSAQVQRNTPTTYGEVKANILRLRKEHDHILNVKLTIGNTDLLKEVKNLPDCDGKQKLIAHLGAIDPQLLELHVCNTLEQNISLSSFCKETVAQLKAQPTRSVHCDTPVPCSNEERILIESAIDMDDNAHRKKDDQKSDEDLLRIVTAKPIRWDKADLIREMPTHARTPEQAARLAKHEDEKFWPGRLTPENAKERLNKTTKRRMLNGIFCSNTSLAEQEYLSERQSCGLEQSKLYLLKAKELREALQTLAGLRSELDTKTTFDDNINLDKSKVTFIQQKAKWYNVVFPELASHGSAPWNDKLPAQATPNSASPAKRHKKKTDAATEICAVTVLRALCIEMGMQLATKRVCTKGTQRRIYSLDRTRLDEVIKHHSREVIDDPTRPCVNALQVNQDMFAQSESE